MKHLFITRQAKAASFGLCRPMGVGSGQDVVFTKQFPGSDSSQTIRLRPFCLDADVPLAFEWVRKVFARRAWKKVLPASQLEQTYTYMLQCDFAQSFVATLNDVPLCLVDVYQMKHHDLSVYLDPAEGDYVVELLLSPDKKVVASKALPVIRACIDYFFGFPEVKRVIAEPDVYNKIMKEALQNAGFHFIRNLDMQYKMANIFQLTLEDYRKVSSL